MKRCFSFSFSFVLLATVVAGCQSGNNERLTQWILSGFQRSPEAIVADAIDPADPDRQREAIASLSSHSWGLEEPYLKAYSLLAGEADPGVRVAAINALGRAEAEQAKKYAPQVLKGLDDPVPAVRIEAAGALGKMNVDAAAEPLSGRARRDTDPAVRVASVRALTGYRTRPVLNVLLRCLDDPEFSVRFAARGALNEMTGLDAGCEVNDWNRRLAERPDPFQRPACEAGSSWWPF